MIDFHSHFLPNVDDGSKSVEETRQMLKLAYSQGVRYMVATPHFYADQMIPKDFLEKRQRAFDSILPQPDMPQIILGAEVAYFNNMSRSESLQQMQIGNTGLLLVEMPFCAWSDRMVEDVCMLADRQGLTPVLAHVERYRDKQQFPKFRDRLLSSGVLFQCNAAAFLRFSTRSWALKQLREGCVHFLGSDCHNLTTRTPNLGDGVQVIGKKMGSEYLDDIWDFSAEALQLI